MRIICSIARNLPNYVRSAAYRLRISNSENRSVYVNILSPARSSMGSQKGFLGKSLLAFVILCCLVRRWRPVLFLHECTRLFKWQVFLDEQLLPGYLIHSMLVNPTEYGFPINRSRAYSSIVRDDWALGCGLDQIFRLHITPSVDAGCFFAAHENEAAGAAVPYNEMVMET